MLITDSFIFAHLPKTGGVFLQSVIKAHFRVLAEWEGDQSHHSIEFLPPEHRHKPIFAILRNPWDWYVSWFTYCQAGMNNQEFLRNYALGERTFSNTIKNLLAPNHSDADINQFMKEQNIGLFEMHRFHIMDLECSTHDITYGRLEKLAEDFSGFLDNQSIAIPAGLDSSIGGPPRNNTEHGLRRDYYDEELKNLVAEKERRIIRVADYVYT